MEPVPFMVDILKRCRGVVGRRVRVTFQRTAYNLLPWFVLCYSTVVARLHILLGPLYADRCGVSLQQVTLTARHLFNFVYRWWRGNRTGCVSRLLNRYLVRCDAFFTAVVCDALREHRCVRYALTRRWAFTPQCSDPMPAFSPSTF